MNYDLKDKLLDRLDDPTELIEVLELTTEEVIDALWDIIIDKIDVVKDYLGEEDTYSTEEEI